MKNKILYWIFFYTCILLISGCNDKQVKSIKLDLVLLDPQLTDSINSRYSKNIKDIASPIEDACSSKVDIVFYPLTLKRVDIDKETNIEYETNRPSINYEKIKAVKRGLKDFFDESTPPAWIYLPQNKKFDISGYVG